MPIAAHLPASESFRHVFRSGQGQRIHSHQTVNKIGDAANAALSFPAFRW